MKRANGLDKHGNPMTVRGGIADLLEAVPGGRMVIVYSGGLHHVQVPGQKFPNLFKTISLSFEFHDIDQYRNQIREATRGKEFKKAVRADLEQRRDLYCNDESPTET